MRGELEARDNQLSGVTLELEKLRGEQHLLKGEIKDREQAIATLQTELDKIRGEVLEREVAIANLKAELAARGDKQLSLFPPEPPEPTPEPLPLQPTSKGEGETKKIPAGDKVKAKAEPPIGANGAKLLSAAQMAEKINTTYSPQKPIKAHNLRDWYKPDSTCSDSYRAEKESLYHYRFSHQDASKAYWFEILPEG